MWQGTQPRERERDISSHPPSLPRLCTVRFPTFDWFSTKDLQKGSRREGVVPELSPGAPECQASYVLLPLSSLPPLRWQQRGSPDALGCPRWQVFLRLQTLGSRSPFLQLVPACLFSWYVPEQGSPGDEEVEPLTTGEL